MNKSTSPVLSNNANAINESITQEGEKIDSQSIFDIDFSDPEFEKFRNRELFKPIQKAFSYNR